MVMQYFQFLERLKKRIISRVYLFSGEEEFLKEEALARLEKILFSEKGVDEKEVFDDEVSVSTLNERLNTVSLFNKSKLAVIKKINKECEDILLKYIKAPSSTTYLVAFVDRKWNTSPFFVEFKKFYEGDMLNWLISRAGDNKKILRGDAARVFIERLGTDLALLSEGLERAINYIGAKKEIEVKDICEIVGDEKKDAVFDLTDALASQDLPACLTILNKLFLAFSSPQEILALLGWQARQLYTLKKGGELKIPQFFLKRLKGQAQRFSEKQLEECLNGLKIADREIKEGLKNPKFSLELFFFNFFSKLGEVKA